MKYLVTPEAPDHLPLATLPCLTEQCNRCGKNFSRQYSLSKYMLVVHGASRPWKILQDIYLAKNMAGIGISFVICHIAFKTRIGFQRHMKRGAHLLGPGPEDVKGGILREFMLLLDGISVWDKAHKRERVHTCNVCDKAFKVLGTPEQHIFGSTVAMCLCSRVVARSSRPTTESTHELSLFFWFFS